MPDKEFFRASPQDLGCSRDRLDILRQRVRRDVESGLLPAAQLAVARDGRIGWFETFGNADDDTLFCVFSCTKALISSAAWLLVESGQLVPAERVSEVIPEFGTNGKQGVLVEHLFTHLAGFPHAPFGALEWSDRELRCRRFASWRLNWPEGSRFEYHPSSSMWVVAEILERKTGMDFREFVRARVLEPLGLSDDFVLGIPEDSVRRVAEVVHTGTGITREELQRIGLEEPPATAITEEAILSLNDPCVRAVGIPGAGGICTAAALALFYQALLHGRSLGRPRVWSDETLSGARRVRSGELRDPQFGTHANRALGVVVAGDQDRNWRGFGHTNSSEAFGHGGAGGQIGWADPRTGVSFAFCTNGHDRHSIRQGARTVSLSTKAASLVG